MAGAAPSPSLGRDGRHAPQFNSAPSSPHRTARRATDQPRRSPLGLRLRGDRTRAQAEAPRFYLCHVAGWKPRPSNFPSAPTGPRVVPSPSLPGRLCRRCPGRLEGLRVGRSTRKKANQPCGPSVRPYVETSTSGRLINLFPEDRSSLSCFVRRANNPSALNPRLPHLTIFGD